MILAFHQPNYLPNLGFFYKMSQVDLFLVGTNLQFEKKEGWQQRHKIPTPHGDLWLTVPVHGSQNDLIRDVRISSTDDWRRKHKAAISLTYTKTAEKEALSRLLELYDVEWERLGEMNMAFIELLGDLLGIKTPLLFDEEVKGKKWELLVNCCKKYGADGYMSGVGAKDYMTQEYYDALSKEGISHCFVEGNYTAQYPYSTVHYLLSEGREKVREMLRI
jgi:hypothetical protein